MTPRSLLYAGLVALAFVTVLATLLPALRYRPGPAGSVTLEASHLEPGHWQASEARGTRYYLARADAQQLSVLAVPAAAGAGVWLPAAVTAGPPRLCHDFGPLVTAGGGTAPPPLGCRDAPSGSTTAAESWDERGRCTWRQAPHPPGPCAPLPVPRYVRLGTRVRILPGS